MAMKITIVQGAFLPLPPVAGGAVEKRWFSLGQEFAKIGCEVTHISKKNPHLPDDEFVGGVRHLRVNGYKSPRSGILLKWLDMLYTMRACRKIPKNSDVIITNTFWAPILLPRKLARKAYVDVGRMPKGQMRLYRKAMRLRANSSATAQAIRCELPILQHHRVSLIPNPLPFSISSHFESKTKQPHLLYCGRIHAEKGLDLLIRAMHLIPNPWPLRIVGAWRIEEGGGGEVYRKKLQKEAGNLPIEFVEAIYDVGKLHAEYENAAVFVYPSVAEKGETFGVAPLEAMAWGCVPVVSDLDCFKDFIQHDENGLIFDHRGPHAAKRLAEAILKIMEAAETRERMADSAVQVRKTHSTEGIARRFLEDFGKLGLTAVVSTPIFI